MPSGLERYLEAGARIIKFALAFYRKEPIQMPDAEHTESMLILLRLANGDAELLAWATELTRAGEDELHRACIAFIEHAFFTVATDHFGVLGLNPWAKASDVKEHYRLLMRLFHPDRGLVNSARADKYAAMINQAYAALKQEIPFTVEVMNRKPATLLKHETQSAGMRGRMIRAALSERVGVSFLSWLTPAKLLLVVALLATLIVLMFLEPYKKPKTGNFDVLDVATADAGTAVSVETDHESSQMEYISNASVMTDVASADNGSKKIDPPAALTLSEGAKIGADVKPDPGAIKQPERTKMQPPLGQAYMRPQPKVIMQPKDKVSNAALPSNVSVKTDAAIGDVDSSARPAIGVVVVPEQPAADIITTANANVNSANMARADNAAEPMPTTRELRELLIQFIDGYERGDIEAFMQPFGDELASDEAGGRSGFKQAYSDLFDMTTSREMTIQNLHWSKKTKLTIGEADYRIKTRSANKSEIYASHGTFRFEVVKTNNKAKIVGFYYVVAND